MNQPSVCHVYQYETAGEPERFRCLAGVVLTDRGFIMKISQIAAGLVAMAVLPAVAAYQDLAVTPAGDVTSYRYWGGGFSDRGSMVDANPNQVSHDYAWGSGAAFDASLTFDLGALGTLTSADLQGATLNFLVEGIWTSGRDDVANIAGVGTVLASGGTGWKSFDVSTQLRQALDSQASSVGFSFSYTGYSGMTFGSAEGGQPAFLRVTAVPEAESLALALAGLMVVGLLAKRRAA